MLLRGGAFGAPFCIMKQMVQELGHDAVQL
jgi:hypothetical protein